MTTDVFLVGSKSILSKTSHLLSPSTSFLFLPPPRLRVSSRSRHISTVPAHSSCFTFVPKQQQRELLLPLKNQLSSQLLQQPVFTVALPPIHSPATEEPPPHLLPSSLCERRSLSPSREARKRSGGLCSTLHTRSVFSDPHCARLQQPCRPASDSCTGKRLQLI